MPTISVTQDEHDAIMFYLYETMDKAENAEDDDYIDDYNRHCDALDKFREKFHRAKNRENTKKRVKNALKIASKGLK